MRKIYVQASMSKPQRAEVCLSKTFLLVCNFAFVSFFLLRLIVITCLFFTLQVDKSIDGHIELRRTDEPQPSTSGLQSQSSVSE